MRSLYNGSRGIKLDCKQAALQVDHGLSGHVKFPRLIIITPSEAGFALQTIEHGLVVGGRLAVESEPQESLKYCVPKLRVQI